MEDNIQPIPLPDISGPQNRNLRRRLRYHEKKVREEIEQLTGKPEES